MISVDLAKVKIGFFIPFKVNCTVVVSKQGAILVALASIITVSLEASGVNIGVAVSLPDKVPEPETILQLMVDGL